MKRLLLTGALVGALLCLTTDARPQTVPHHLPPAQPSTLLQCAAVIVVIGMGIVILRAGCRMCNRLASNLNNQVTNNADALTLPPLIAGASGSSPMTIQSAAGLGSAWVDGYQISLQQTDGQIVGVISQSGLPIATNSVAGPTNDSQTVVLNFPGLPTPASWTNAQCRIFRIVQ
jgi:hypothetical protein